MKPNIIIVSLGFGDPDLLNLKTVSTLRNAQLLILRTSRHPLAAWLDLEHIPYTSLDCLYDKADNFDELNLSIASFLIRKLRFLPLSMLYRMR